MTPGKSTIDPYIDSIVTKLVSASDREFILCSSLESIGKASAVLLLLGLRETNATDQTTPCLILNKRSKKVIQPGDLCCPGGGVSPIFDRFSAKLLQVPGTSLTRWPGWAAMKKKNEVHAAVLAQLYAAALREGMEEMRLNPFAVRFLGFLRPHALTLFNKTIYPMVAWVTGQVRFYPNWEVEEIVSIPLKALIDSDNYGIYRIKIDKTDESGLFPSWKEYPCFVHRSRNRPKLLWGVTFRITVEFLKIAYGFHPPDHENLPVYYGHLDDDYLNASKKKYRD